MRYILLQQVGGPAWMVYDSARSMEVKTFTDKFAKDVAAELLLVLNRGTIDDGAITAITEAVPTLQKVIRKRSQRQ